MINVNGLGPVEKVVKVLITFYLQSEGAFLRSSSDRIGWVEISKANLMLWCNFGETPLRQGISGARRFLRKRCNFQMADVDEKRFSYTLDLTMLPRNGTKVDFNRMFVVMDDRPYNPHEW